MGEFSDTERSMYLGVDLGGMNTTVASSVPSSPSAVQVETNALANRSTPTIVGFNKRLRTIGETAESEIFSNPANTLTTIVPLVGVKGEEKLAEIKKRFALRFSHNARFDAQLGCVIFPVKFNQTLYQVTPEHAIAVFLRRLCTTVLENNSFLEEEENGEKCGATNAEKKAKLDRILGDVEITIAAPDSFNEYQTQSIYMASILAGLVRVKVVPQKQALLQQWAAKNGAEYFAVYKEDAGKSRVNATKEAEEKKHNNEEKKHENEEKEPENIPLYASILDVGYTEATFQIFKIINQNITHVASVTAPLGTHEMVSTLTEYFKKEILSNGKIPNFEDHSKVARKLFTGTSKLMLDLSVLNDSVLDLEAIHEDQDVRLKITRAGFEELCRPHKEVLRCLLLEGMREAGVKEGGEIFLCSVDLVGGGNRVPWVQRLVEETLFEGDTSENLALSEKNLPPKRLRFTLDGSSAVACGSALFSANLQKDLHLEDIQSNQLCQTDIPDQQREQKLEEEMGEIEEKEIQRQRVRNDFENLIITSKSTINDPQNAKFFKVQVLNEIVDKADTWLCVESDPDATTTEEYETGLTNLRAELAEHMGEFEKFQKKTEEEREAHIQAQTEATAATREDDPDVQLPPAQIVRRALKNKTEGTELFKGGSIELAALRYQRALQFCVKIESHQTQFKAEADEIALSVNLNLAQCYLKLETDATFRKAIYACDAALQIQPQNTKAIYRKALAQENLKEYDNALSTLQGCEDSAEVEVQKSKERIAKMLKLQEEKSKKVYAKMFG